MFAKSALCTFWKDNTERYPVTAKKCLLCCFE